MRSGRIAAAFAHQAHPPMEVKPGGKDFLTQKKRHAPLFYVSYFQIHITPYAFGFKAAQACGLCLYLLFCGALAQLLQDFAFEAGNLHLGNPHLSGYFVLRFIGKIAQHDDGSLPRFQRAEQFLEQHAV